MLRFQFLMVRLKDIIHLCAGSGTIVSIPYGSIKRFFRYSYSYFFSVSIPYGSIKSLDAFNDLNSNNLFQFLMVRLKVVL